MKINIVSDLHLEFGKGDLELPGGDILIAAGDIALIEKHTEFFYLLKWARKYNHVLFVAGNHEFYNSDIIEGLNNLKWYFSNIASNIYVLENESIVLGDTTFIGATLWSDYSTNEKASIVANNGINDFYLIYKDNFSAKFRAEDAQRKFNVSYAYIEDALRKSTTEKKVVITHHAPSWQSVSARYKGQLLNHAYASNLEHIMQKKYAPNLWVHGHTHDSFDYKVGNTRVICNPRGYFKKELNPSFNPNLEVEL